MYKNRNGDRNNIAGINVRRLRLQQDPVWSQRFLSARLQLFDHDIGKNAIQQMEAGTRFITDIELKALAEVFKVSVEDLLTVPGQSSGKAKYSKDEQSGERLIAEDAKSTADSGEKTAVFVVLTFI